MNNLLSKRIQSVPESFIRKILKISIQNDIISFAGGHPNAGLFPVEEIAAASKKVLQTQGRQVLQYASTEGDADLREWISKRYKAIQNLDISADNILITSGSQQALDLLGKVLLDEGDSIAIENPGYLGAIQAFSVYQPKMHGIALDENGMDVSQLSTVLKEHNPKLIYTVPNFQNPTGISYSEENRKAVASAISQTNALLIQDDPYGELRFSGKPKSNFYSLLPKQTILLGSFSKIVVPSFRMGWIVIPDWLVKPMVIAKQASDLHTNYFTQRLVFQYLSDNSLDDHIAKIRNFYGKQKEVMMDAIDKNFPTEVNILNSEGGMFLWATLPGNLSAMDLFDKAIEKERVAFVPGEPFYVASDEKTPVNTLRLSFVTADENAIKEGIMRLGRCI